MTLPTTSGVYCIQLADARFKIGVTRNLRDRVSKQNEHNGLVVIAPIPNMRNALLAEKRLHGDLCTLIVGTWHGPAHGYDVFNISLFDLHNAMKAVTDNVSLYIPEGYDGSLRN